MTLPTNKACEMAPCPNPWCEALEREGDFSPAVRLYLFGTYRVVCTSCVMEGPPRPTEAEAITAWNTRTPAPPVTREAVLEEAAKKVEGLNGLIWATVAARAIRALKSEPVVDQEGEAAVNQNDAMRQELAHVGNLISDLARAMRVDQANPDGSWPDLAGRIGKLLDAARFASTRTPMDGEVGELIERAARSVWSTSRTFAEIEDDCSGESWARLPEYAQDHYRDLARSALSHVPAADTLTAPDGEVEARAKAAALKSLRWAGVTVLEEAVEKFHADDLNNHRGHLSRHMAGRYLDAFLAARLALTDPPNLPPGD